MASSASGVRSADGSLWKILPVNQWMNTRENWSKNCSRNVWHSQQLPVWPESSKRWLQMYVNQKYYLLPKQVEVTQKNLASWKFSVTRCGHLWGVKRTSSGFGWLLTKWLVKLWEFMLANVAVPVLGDSGNRYRQFTREFSLLKLPPETLDANVPSATPTSGRLMSRLSLANGILAVGKETGRTSYIERLNNTLRYSCRATRS